VTSTIQNPASLSPYSDVFHTISIMCNTSLLVYLQSFTLKINSTPLFFKCERTKKENRINAKIMKKINTMVSKAITHMALKRKKIRKEKKEREED
jgi:hypothetical protein